jgi:catechol 2,3-dioxygenase-like lactoylglutathione lyase family enzyme
MPITTTPDHVAVAVPDIERAAQRWHDELGGGWLGDGVERLGTPVGIRQMAFPNGGKLELLQPMGDGFARAFVERFGPRIHHVTLKVPDALLPAVEVVREAGYDVVDVSTEGGWHEAFLRPSQVGGMIVQIAWEEKSDEEWFEETGRTPEAPRGAAALLGPTLTHPDLDAADHLWTTLGGKITREDDVLTVRWDGSPLDVRIEAGPTAGPVGLRFAGTDPMPAHDAAGPAVIVD